MIKSALDKGTLFFGVMFPAPNKKGDLAVSLRDSTVMKECRVNSSNLYIMIARMNYEEEMTPEEENAIKIANFLIK